MGLLFIDVQTQSQKKLFSIYRYFSLFFLTDLILSDRADNNMNRQGIIRPFRKLSYFPSMFQTKSRKKLYSIFRSILIFELFDIYYQKNSTMQIYKVRSISDKQCYLYNSLASYKLILTTNTYN